MIIRQRTVSELILTLGTKLKSRVTAGCSCVCVSRQAGGVPGAWQRGAGAVCGGQGPMRAR